MFFECRQCAGQGVRAAAGQQKILRIQLQMFSSQPLHYLVRILQPTCYLVLLYPGADKKVFMRFDKIEDYVLSEAGEVGVIIHENRFTYRERGLHKVADLGQVWEEK